MTILPSKKAKTISKKNIAELLLVEDNSNEVEFTLRAFKKHNPAHKVHVVKDGAEALDYVFCTGTYVQRSIDNTPKLVLLDLKLPKVDGLEVLKKIKSDERTKTIPVVVLTASQEKKDMVESYKYGANSYIVKAVRFEELFESIIELGKYWLLLNEGSE